MTTKQMVELRRMEKRHLEDKRKLEVPEVAVSDNKHKSSNVRVPRKMRQQELPLPCPGTGIVHLCS